jgi:hypothetical protein
MVDIALVDVFRERLCMKIIVGFTKSCCSVLPGFLGVGEVGPLSAAVPAAESSGLGGSDMAVNYPHLSWVPVASALWQGAEVAACDMVVSEA